MEGIIVQINEKQGQVAVDTNVCGYTIFEMLADTNFNTGDKVSWSDDQTLGHDMINNLTKGEIVEVFFQNHMVSRANLAKQLLY